jgi:hypothetical protein
MIKRLLFDRIDVDGNRPPIDEAPQLPLYIDAGAAEAPLTFPDDAMLGAEEALYHVFFVMIGLIPGVDCRGMALSAILAGERDGGPESGPGGLADQFVTVIGGQGRGQGKMGKLGNSGQSD